MGMQHQEAVAALLALLGTVFGGFWSLRLRWPVFRALWQAKPELTWVSSLFPKIWSVTGHVYRLFCRPRPLSSKSMSQYHSPGPSMFRMTSKSRGCRWLRRLQGPRQSNVVERCGKSQTHLAWACENWMQIPLTWSGAWDAFWGRFVTVQAGVCGGSQLRVPRQLWSSEGSMWLLCRAAYNRVMTWGAWSHWIKNWNKPAGKKQKI